MLLRGSSKDRSSRKVTPPGPSYMSNEQFANYLAELRDNRISRPSGARPLPSASHDRHELNVAESSVLAGEEHPVRSETSHSHRRAQSAAPNLSTRSRAGRALVQEPRHGAADHETSTEGPVTLLKPSVVVPSATYIERGQRWMEKEEVVSLRDCLEDMDLQKQRQREEAKLHQAAQQEASELVWQHQNPEATRSDGPYKYKEHLRKNSYAHARTQSVRGVDIVTGLARDIPRSVSGGSLSSGSMLSDSRVSSGSSGKSSDKCGAPTTRNTLVGPKQPSDVVISKKSKKLSSGLTKTTDSSSRRRSSGKRNISGEPAMSFTGEQIWEEPEGIEAVPPQREKSNDVPAPLRLKKQDPLNRAQSAQDLPQGSSTTPLEQIRKRSTIEIHHNPPSQSRDPSYTANPPMLPSAIEDGSEVTRKDGIEIRAEDIRQATTKSLRTRSPHLPTPAVVSDKPSRPIVSFDANWKPREADVKPVEERMRERSDDRLGFSKTSKTLPVQPAAKDFYSATLPTIQLPSPPADQVNGASSPSIPTINISPPTVPTIILPDTPMISVSGSAPIPSVTISDAPTAKSGSSRPLPNPKSTFSRPLPLHAATDPGARSKRHWSPAVGSRATATCHQCELPIEGRVVAVKGLFQRFHPQCFICCACGIGLEALEISPEPEEYRAERLSRIRRRAQGEQLEEIEGQTMADDGDERLRFYCHLDWHELYAPRCKHCKTPIIGEHAVALGAHWHYGHFFCAECGDPFEQGMTHIEKDGYAWCLECQTKRTQRQAPKCKKCRRPVIGQYVQALGGEYHDKCFRCATCQGGFDDGQIFPRLDGNETVAVCTQCMERELKA